MRGLILAGRCADKTGRHFDVTPRSIAPGCFTFYDTSDAKLPQKRLGIFKRRGETWSKFIEYFEKKRYDAIKKHVLTLGR